MLLPPSSRRACMSWSMSGTWRGRSSSTRPLPASQASTFQLKRLQVINCILEGRCSTREQREGAAPDQASEWRLAAWRLAALQPPFLAAAPSLIARHYLAAGFAGLALGTFVGPNWYWFSAAVVMFLAQHAIQGASTSHSHQVFRHLHATGLLMRASCCRLWFPKFQSYTPTSYHTCF